MTAGKWWEYQECVIGESGEGFALARIKKEFESPGGGTDVDLLVASIMKVSKDLAGIKGDVEELNAELLYCGLEGIFVVGGEGEKLGPYDWATVGQGSPVCDTRLEGTLPVLSKRTFKNVDRIVRAAFLATQEKYDGVYGPFFSYKWAPHES